MKKFAIKHGRARTLPRLIATGIAFVLALLFLSLRSVEYISEYIFSRGISRWWITAAGSICGIFPFSIFEIGAGIAIIYALICIVKIIVRLIRRRKNALLPLANLLLMVSLICAVYAGTASFAYYREDLINYLPHYESILADEQTQDILDIAIAEMNALAEEFDTAEDGSLISPYSDEELAEICRKQYDRLSDDYFTPFTAELKPLITSDIFSDFGILGISFQPTGEANYNKNTDATDMPQTMLHELAHSKGVMYESDANLLAVYLCLTSDDDFLRYSGYHNCITQIAKIVTLHNPDITLQKACENLSPTVRAHMNAATANYRSHESFITEVGEFINDTYLKLSGASDGTGSYYVAGKVVNGSIVYSPMQKVCIEILLAR